MPPKRKGAAGKDKKEALPSKKNKGKKETETSENVTEFAYYQSNQL